MDLCTTGRINQHALSLKLACDLQHVHSAARYVQLDDLPVIQVRALNLLVN